MRSIFNLTNHNRIVEMARKQVPITELAEKHLQKLIEKRKAKKLPYGRTAIVADAILNYKG